MKRTICIGLGVIAVALLLYGAYRAVDELLSAGPRATFILAAHPGRLASLGRPPPEVYAVAFAPDGQSLASGGSDQTVRIWDPATGRQLRAWTGHDRPISSLAFAPDGRTLASGGNDGTVRLWDVTTGQARLTLNLPPVPGGWVVALSLAFSPDGRILAATVRKNLLEREMAGEAIFWKTSTGQQLRVIPAFPKYGGDFVQAAFLPDSLVVGLTRGRGVALIDVTTGQEQAFLPAPAGSSVWRLAVSPDGQLMASGENKPNPAVKKLPSSVVIWDVATKQQTASLPGHTATIWTLAFAPDSRTLASGSADETVRLWDVRAGCEFITLKGHTGSVLGVAFAPDGRPLASCSADGTLRLWDVQELLKEAAR